MLNLDRVYVVWHSYDTVYTLIHLQIQYVES
jgi:hypothetical protein